VVYDIFFWIINKKYVIVLFFFRLEKKARSSTDSSRKKRERKRKGISESFNNGQVETVDKRREIIRNTIIHTCTHTHSITTNKRESNGKIYP
jgi:hypothetical protein